MNFLCPKHRQDFSRLSLDQQRDIWLIWMERASAAYAQQQWRDLISLVGCAFELASLAHNDPRKHMHLELTLSAICLSNTFREVGEPVLAMGIIDSALEQLELEGMVSMSCNCQCSVSECLLALNDPESHQAFFRDYLNWPAHGNTTCPSVERRHTLH